MSNRIKEAYDLGCQAAIADFVKLSAKSMNGLMSAGGAKNVDELSTQGGKLISEKLREGNFRVLDMLGLGDRTSDLASNAEKYVDPSVGVRKFSPNTRLKNAINLMRKIPK